MKLRDLYKTSLLSQWKRDCSIVHVYDKDIYLCPELKVSKENVSEKYGNSESEFNLFEKRISMPTK